MSQEVAERPRWEPYAGQGYAELSRGAAVIPGGDLVKGDLLIGVPFVITAMTFRTGDYMNAATKLNGPYVTVECLTGDETAFARAVKRGRVTGDCPFGPEEEILFNEGGTGAYRQCVQVWEACQWIVLPDGPNGGEYGVSRFDSPLGTWTVTSDIVTTGADSDGQVVYSAPVRLLCPRGLRVSEYENQFTKEGRTRYFG